MINSKLNYFTISDEYAASEANLINKINSFDNLVLKITNISFKHIIIKELDLENNLKYNLFSLSLANCQIGNKEAKSISNFLKHSNLNILDLSQNNIEFKGALYISEALKCNKTLNTLYLNNNHIGTLGAYAISEALDSNIPLEFLYLQHNFLHNEGIMVLFQGLKNNLNLNYLFISNNIFNSNIYNFLKINENNDKVNICLNNKMYSIYNLEHELTKKQSLYSFIYNLKKIYLLANKIKTNKLPLDFNIDSQIQINKKILDNINIEIENLNIINSKFSVISINKLKKLKIESEYNINLLKHLNLILNCNQLNEKNKIDIRKYKKFIKSSGKKIFIDKAINIENSFIKNYNNLDNNLILKLIDYEALMNRNINDYKIINNLDNNIIFCKNLEGEKIVLKKFQDTENDKKKLLNEISSRYNLQNRNYIVPINGVFINIENNDDKLDINYYIEFPEISSKNLIQWVKCIEDPEIKLEYRGTANRSNKNQFEILKMLINICNYVTELHCFGIEHRGLTLENILIVNDIEEVKLIDFKICKIINSNPNETLQNVKKSINYAPPERKSNLVLESIDLQVNNLVNHYKFGSWDIYSLGIIIYELYSDDSEFINIENFKLTNDLSLIKQLKNMSDTIYNLILSMLNKESQDRISIKEVNIELQKELNSMLNTKIEIKSSSQFSNFQNFDIQNLQKKFNLNISQIYFIKSDNLYFESIINNDIESQSLFIEFKSIISPKDDKELKIEMEEFGRLLFFCIKNNIPLYMRLSPLIYSALSSKNSNEDLKDLYHIYNRFKFIDIDISELEHEEYFEEFLNYINPNIFGTKYQLNNLNHIRNGFIENMDINFINEIEKMSWLEIELLCCGNVSLSKTNLKKLIKPNDKNSNLIISWIENQDLNILRRFLLLSIGYCYIPNENIEINIISIDNNYKFIKFDPVNYNIEIVSSLEDDEVIEMLTLSLSEMKYYYCK